MSEGPTAQAVEDRMTAIARRLRSLRFDSGLRLVDLAARSGLSEVHLYRLEQGERAPSLRALLAIAQAYDVPPGQLLDVPAPGAGDPVAHAASAEWVGSEQSGGGVMTSNGVRVRFDHESRTTPSDGDGDGRGSPESMIGMALAGCFSMSLADRLEQGGFSPERIETLAKVDLGCTDGTHAISEIGLVCEAVVADIDDARFQALARATRETCVVARALAAVPTTLDAHLLRLAPRRHGPRP
jgi:osmotically inducible protein OsmC